MCTRPFSLFLLVILISCLGCQDETAPEGKVNADGLTKEITDLVPRDILDEMERLGMPINGGDNPPSIEGEFFASPFILLSTNRQGDPAGFQFSDYQVRFYDQDNDALTIAVDYDNGPESGNGLGSFIVGDGRAFSVFVEIDAVHTDGSAAQMTHVISGTITDTGIDDLFFANFMIDDKGDPTGVWIDNGDGRVIYDEDGVSERL